MYVFDSTNNDHGLLNDEVCQFANRHCVGHWRISNTKRLAISFCLYPLVTTNKYAFIHSFN